MIGADLRKLSGTAFFQIICVVLLISANAFASGGACPTGANYLSPSGTLVTLSSLGVTSCYFVSASGADTNNGTSESTPWLHAPQMPNCSGTCATVQNQNGGIPPGTGIILRGGDTWHFGNSNATPYTGGTWEWKTVSSPTGTAATRSISEWTRHGIQVAHGRVRSSRGTTRLQCEYGIGRNCISTTDSYGQPEFYVSSCAYQMGSTNDFIDEAVCSITSSTILR